MSHDCFKGMIIMLIDIHSCREGVLQGALFWETLRH